MLALVHHHSQFSIRPLLMVLLRPSSQRLQEHLLAVRLLSINLNVSDVRANDKTAIEMKYISINVRLICLSLQTRSTAIRRMLTEWPNHLLLCQEARSPYLRHFDRLYRVQNAVLMLINGTEKIDRDALDEIATFITTFLDKPKGEMNMSEFDGWICNSWPVWSRNQITGRIYGWNEYKRSY